MYVIYLNTGTSVTLRADSFARTDDEVIFYDGAPKRRRDRSPDIENAVAVFRQAHIAGFAEQDRIQDNDEVG